MNLIFTKADNKIKTLRHEADAIAEVLRNQRLQDWLTGIVLELQGRFPSFTNKEIDPHFSASRDATSDHVTISLSSYSVDVTYDELLSQPGTRTDYSGTSLVYSFEETLLFTNIKATCQFTAKIPATDVEFLVGMEKIAREISTTTHAMC